MAQLDTDARCKAADWAGMLFWRIWIDDLQEDSVAYDDSVGLWAELGLPEACIEPARDWTDGGPLTELGAAAGLDAGCLAACLDEGRMDETLEDSVAQVETDARWRSAGGQSGILRGMLRIDGRSEDSVAQEDSGGGSGQNP